MVADTLIRIGLISDTHGLLRPEALAALAGVAQIIHAGDVGGPEILAALREVAPVTAVRGNTDTSPWGQSLPFTASIVAGGVQIQVIHDLHTLGQRPADAGFGVVVSGHTHRALVQEREGVLFVNPGAAGQRRFSLPLSVGIMEIRDGAASVRIVEIGVKG